MSTPDKRTTFSLVMTVHDQAEEIRNELPRLLEQQYEDYEVIVVDEHSSDETADLLNYMKTDHPQLYTTFLPKYQFQQFRRRLAFTLGVKAARKEWIVFTDLTTTPPSHTWLEELSEYTGDSVLILGYVNRKSGDVKLKLFDEIIGDMARGNKLNLLFTDGKYLYAHTNCRGTMHYLVKDGAALLSTQPLNGENWQLVPFGQLLVFNKGKLIKTGTEHHHEYIQSEDEMKLLYQIFANL